MGFIFNGPPRAELKTMLYVYFPANKKGKKMLEEAAKTQLQSFSCRCKLWNQVAAPPKAKVALNQKECIRSLMWSDSGR